MYKSVRASQFSIQQLSDDHGSITLTQKSKPSYKRQVNFETQKFEPIPRTAAVSHRMKGFCCRVPNLTQGLAPYQNT